MHELIDLSSSSRVFAGKIIHKSRISKPHHKEKISREIELHRYIIYLQYAHLKRIKSKPNKNYELLIFCHTKRLLGFIW